MCNITAVAQSLLWIEFVRCSICKLISRLV
jgi:hypothetical protein